MKSAGQWFQSGGGKAIVQWFQRNGKIIAVGGGGIVVGAAGASILKEKGFKKRMKEVEKDNAAKFDKEMKRKMEELRKRYQDNENELRRQVNAYLRKMGYKASF